MCSQATASRDSASVPKPDSFHGHLARISDDLTRMQLPESNPEFLRGRGRGGAVSFAGKPVSMENVGQRMTKFLLNVAIQGSFAVVRVILPTNNTVEELIEAVIHIYTKEKRRPLLKETDSRHFDLHYSQYSFQSLNPKEKLINLDSRDFFLCLKPSSSSDQAKKAVAETSFPMIVS
ncbi:PREDICTED: uncharacterized protein LOC109115958 [Nelumbo nucifera]|uniref:Uncharacterized protein LOC109115958 n=1 Tax=Nelumbo nucifera TaxID=4432 RepID=A0A1U8QD14_NELNU|nr:PREDICTED: uncharacterized protein LOC109115958 [Nelumbo nucifera]